MIFIQNKDQKFGKHLLDKFYLDHKSININTGSFGSPPRYVGEAYQRYREYMDSNPDKFIRFEMEEKIKETKVLVGNYINADIDNIIFVDNASDGANSVFKSIIKPKWKVIAFSNAYKSIKSLLTYLKDRLEIEIIELLLTTETINSNTLLLDSLTNILDLYPDIKFATIDHISSTPAVILPVKSIINIMRNRGIITFIDGAHGVGQIKLDMNELKPDFYVSNFHKWGMTPKSVAFMYVNDDFKHLIYPNIIAGYGGGLNDFTWTGTKDYSAIFSIKEALEFRSNYGEEDIMNYNHNLAIKGAEIMASIFGTDLLIKDNSHIGSMSNIRLPLNDSIKIKEIVDNIMLDHKIYLFTFKFNEIHYARISAQIFNEEEDYIKVANHFMQYSLYNNI
jgi:selenocysteine lyase/cysteine desulfurase